MDQLHEELKEPLQESVVSNVSSSSGVDKNSQSGKSLNSGSLEEISDEDDDQDDREEGNGGGGLFHGKVVILGFLLHYKETIFLKLTCIVKERSNMEDLFS